MNHRRRSNFYAREVFVGDNLFRFGSQIVRDHAAAILAEREAEQLKKLMADTNPVATPTTPEEPKHE